MWYPTIARQSTLNKTNNPIHKITIYLVDITPSHIMVKCLHLRHVRSNHSEARLHSTQQTIQSTKSQSTWSILHHLTYRLSRLWSILHHLRLWSNVSISVMWDPTIARQSALNTTNNSIHKIRIYLVDITPSHIMVKCLHLRHVRSTYSEAVYSQHIKQFNTHHNLFSRYYTISHYGQMSRSPSYEIQP